MKYKYNSAISKRIPQNIKRIPQILKEFRKVSRYLTISFMV